MPTSRRGPCSGMLTRTPVALLAVLTITGCSPTDAPPSSDSETTESTTDVPNDGASTTTATAGETDDTDEMGPVSDLPESNETSSESTDTTETGEEWPLAGCCFCVDWDAWQCFGWNGGEETCLMWGNEKGLIMTYDPHCPEAWTGPVDDDLACDAVCPSDGTTEETAGW